MDELHGFIDSIVFTEPEKGFTVARLKEPKKKDPTCIVGIMPSVQPGETIRCKGIWKHHPEYGRQFEVHSFDLEAPSDLVGIQKYLESGMIKGIGTVYAERIVKEFGIQTLKVLDEDPDRLLNVPGIGKKRIDTIKNCWKEQHSIRDVMIFLRGHGVSPSFAQKIYKAYGERSIEKVSSNPYGLAKEIYGIGFKSADGIAQGLGMPTNSFQRIDAGIEYTLWELSNDGHVCFPEKELIPQVHEVLQVPIEQVQGRLEHLIKNGDLVRERELIWVKPLYLAELGITRELARLSYSPCKIRPVLIDKALPWVEAKLHIELAPEQKTAVALGVKDKTLVVTGGPGTGKSTITKAILAITEKITQRILLCAPTGRAAKRMSEITGKKAFTIHSLLEMNFKTGGFKRNRDNPLECDLIIIDEASMIDTLLMNHLLKAIPREARLILIGDVDQLPSVGPGNVLKDIISSECLSVVQLKQIFRQAAGSRIVTNAHRINQGEFPDISERPSSDFQFIEAEEPADVLQIIVDLVAKRLPASHRFHRFDEIQVLSPMKRGVIGTENINMVLQAQLNPSPSPLVRMGRCFHIGDKVMQIRNNYQKEVYNGDVGKIVEINLSDQMLKVAYDGKIVEYEFLEMDELVLAYAVSIHKYQGSECPCVIIPVHTTHFIMLYRNLLYTGLTRGKRLVVLVGTKKALAIAINNEDAHKRYSGLKETMQQAFQKKPERQSLQEVLF
ncbi:MAG TPA: ATP-dependent RecD-like DNA helicase [Rhabdochlamydiaceae bacterium]|nr:ATP-dependent RecD-like DNA helicase [Rhabdochlamydiaceae bacterium]